MQLAKGARQTILNEVVRAHEIADQRPGVAAQAWKLSLDPLVNVRHALPPPAAAGSAFAEPGTVCSV